MPCDSSHLDPTALESEGSRLWLLLDELMTGAHVDRKRFDGCTDPRSYGKHPQREVLDALTALVCAKCQEAADAHGIHPNITFYSLELQMWWRDHQAVDTAKSNSVKAANPNSPDPRECIHTDAHLGRS